MIHYRIELADPAAHLIKVELHLEAPSQTGHRLMLPAWIPGSYMIREFARHIMGMQATQGGKPLGITQLSKDHWQLAPNHKPVVVAYTLYAYDLSVRAAHFDAQHAFFNPSVLCLLAQDLDPAPLTLELVFPKGKPFSAWRVATTLPQRKALQFSAANYDELIDHPFECGTFVSKTFKAAGVTHEVAVTGKAPLFWPRLLQDMQHICTRQIELFGKPAPFKRYLFLITATGDGYGGLEHRSSTALLTSRNSLPFEAATKKASTGSPSEPLPQAYRNFLGLVSHEYFHSWNVKRVKPAAFEPYQLDRENYTSLLWIFEGFTSYYDDLMLVRSGVITQAEYLQCLSTTINQVMAAPGHQHHSVAQASFEAWTKYYRQDENSPNAQVSYYAKGALVALCLDLLIRDRSPKSLDDVMRWLWQHHGQPGQTGLAENGFAQAVQAATGLDLSRPIHDFAYTTKPLPLKKLLATQGVHLSEQPLNDAAALLGCRLQQRPDGVIVSHVLHGGSMHLAGISAGDRLVAWDGIACDAAQISDWLIRQPSGWRTEAVGFCRGELRHWDVHQTPSPIKRVSLTLPASSRVQAHRWLQRLSPA
jgi:predicted metalloprotease with PDZ domain